MIVLDTDIVSIIQRVDTPAGNQLLARVESAVSREPVLTSVVTYEEQMRGWMQLLAKSRDFQEQIQAYRRLRLHAEYYGGRTLLDFDENAAVKFQQVRGGKIKIATLDLKIASIALVHDATLWTRNLAHFRNVPGLKIHDPLSD